MTLDRAKEINSLLTHAWMVWSGIYAGEPPSLQGISLAEAEEASRVIAAHPGERLPCGRVRLTSHVHVSRVPRLYAWAVVRGQTAPAPVEEGRDA
ncbi:hypothetical protein SAMN02745194_04512 [Roseomonas rosea]|uniref:Uncharacterized protein n=1 Tax=Muricoccus roseus TaxID=198092 RepID=A0A1M6QU35_9PROT|nr:hypothetical protein [Roseomonas rosea]SHK23623.1 hypothetical protein SAMN02745194_04512 [Roseomonas rosea]